MKHIVHAIFVEYQSNSPLDNIQGREAGEYLLILKLTIVAQGI